MIKKLRFKFIAVSMLSLTLVLLVILGSINWMSYRKTINEADEILSVLSANHGMFPLDDISPRKDMPEDMSSRDGNFRKRVFSAETPYETRFFSVLVNESGKVISVDIGRIAAVDQTTAEEYALDVLKSGLSGGFFGNYRFTLSQELSGTRIIFLDCGRNLSTFHTMLFASFFISLLGLSAVLVLLILFSGRIIKPVAESYEKQKRFITDAGHEIKTPLTIIGADADLIELDCGENEWLTDIRRQTKRLTNLTNDLIYLSRMDEEKPQLQLIEFPLSDITEEITQSFQSLAKAQKKLLITEISPMVSFTGDEKSIRQLLSILLDNAIKYSPEGSTILVRLEKESHSVKLTVSNTTLQPIANSDLKHLFDRFYRLDQSRNSATGGYGLGLAIARSIVVAHHGKIWAESPKEYFLSISASMPSERR
ncbi:MAG: sensor histidine kinase [Suilimivivens sp.]